MRNYKRNGKVDSTLTFLIAHPLKEPIQIEGFCGGSFHQFSNFGVYGYIVNYSFETQQDKEFTNQLVEFIKEV